MGVWLGGCVKPQLGFLFCFGNFVCVCFVLFSCFVIFQKKTYEGWWGGGGVWKAEVQKIRVFLSFFVFLNLTIPLTVTILILVP